MERFKTVGDYSDNYDKQLEKITHLQMLLEAEEDKLFELMKMNKDLVPAGDPE